MACYAALLSVTNTLNQINKHPSPPISLHQSQVDSLTLNLTFFQHFLESHSCSGEEIDDMLESRITATAYAAEDLIETHIVDQIDHARSTSNQGENISSVDLYGGLERVIQYMNLIKKEVMEIKIKIVRPQHQPHLHTNFTWGPVLPAFDEALVNQVLDKLTGQQSSLQIIPIVGMGGIGKTTFARYVYSNSLTIHHFDIRVWVTISQDYSVPEILRQVLCIGNRESKMTENELGERVHKMLWSRRYLIVMDDIWSNEVLERVGCFFPDNNNGSRIMITTRLSNLAFELSGYNVFRMKFLDMYKSWCLFCETVFDKELGCPIELENIGKEITRSCRGLPLSIVVIGGLLKKSNRTKSHWEYALQNLNLLLDLEDGEYCLQILHTSYKELPIHLKPCYLYMAIFREDKRIRVSKLIELWVAEGILRSTKDKELEEVAEENIKELIDRNLVIVEKLHWNGKAKICKIHDLLRDLCLREAQKQRFLCVIKHQRGLNILQYMNMERRICIHGNTKSQKYSPALEPTLLTRSLISSTGWPELLQSLSFRLLRVYSGDYYIHCCSAENVETIFKKANLRLVNILLRLPQLSRFPSSWLFLWNLQTLKIVLPRSWESIMAPSDIWKMHLLRHIVIDGLELSYPVYGENDFILVDLLTISRVRNFKCSEAMIKRIPYIKKLKLKYQMSGGEVEYHNFGLNNIGHLKNLQHFSLFINPTAILDRETYRSYLMQNLIFPHSLKKLTLYGTELKWEACATKIGSLPLLQYLRLYHTAFCGPMWETVEGQFCSLRILQIGECEELRYWRTEDTHFPCLELLDLQNLNGLEEIPSSIGDITTLRSIRVVGCSKSAEDSARVIKEEQLELGNTDLQLHISGGAGRDAFMNEIRDTSKYDRETYDRFLEAVDDIDSERIDTDGYIVRVKELFKGKPNLILEFNKLLPEQYKITNNDEEEAP